MASITQTAQTQACTQGTSAQTDIDREHNKLLMCELEKRARQVKVEQ
jgi:hypothetical protein